MLGHLKPRICQLSPASKQHYQHLYCSICASLRQQFGLSASLLINHELTLSLAAFPEISALETQTCACPAKLFCQKKSIVHHQLIDKAAQLCLLLVWLKLLDWEVDRPVFYKKTLRQLLEKKVQPILAQLSPATRQFIDSYLLLIRANTTDFHTNAKMSGLLAQHIFQELGQKTENTQHAMNNVTLLLGELITFADALLDLKQDLATQQFNPIIHAVTENNSTVAQEFSQLKSDYLALIEKIQHLIALENLNAANPLFCEVLQQSLQNLTRKIQRAENAMFATATRNNRRDWTNKLAECINSCGDCLDCCECCCDIGSSCSSASESCACCECSCCECGSCCECSC